MAAPKRRLFAGGAVHPNRARRAAGGRLRRILRRIAVLAAIALLLLGAYLARHPLLVLAGRLLVVRDDLRPADAIVLLSGDIDDRPREAARLYRQGLAPRIVLAREKDPPSVRLGIWPGYTRGAVIALQRLGVPDSAVLVVPFPGGTSSTLDEARAVREWAYGTKPRGVIVVTSLFHTRRARWIFRGQLRRLRIQVLMDPVRDWEYDGNNWWQTEQGLIDYFEEFPKIFHDWWRD